jgi:hypothetical protein
MQQRTSLRYETDSDYEVEKEFASATTELSNFQLRESSPALGPRHISFYVFTVRFSFHIPIAQFTPSTVTPEIYAML